MAAIFLTLLVATQFLPGGRRSLSDWLPALLFLFAVSLAAATTVLCAWALARWLCCWRNFKQSVLACACPVVLIALFYAVENWRGWHAWNQFKREWQAKGVQLDLASVVPPPVPDEQNFAMTPVAFSSYGGVLTRQGKPIPEEKRDRQFVVRMRMSIHGSYSSPTNCFGHRVTGTFTDLKCWQSHYRDLATRSDEFPVPAQPQSPAADVLLALSKYDAVIEELRAASRLPHSRFPVNYDSESPFAVMLPHLAPLKSCAQVLCLRSVAELQYGQPDKALDDVRLSLELTDKIRTEPLLISHLVRLAMLELALTPVWEGLAQHKWSDAQLLALESELARLDFVAAYRLGMQGELGAMHKEMDHLRRHPDRVQQLRELRDFEGNNIGFNPPGGLLARLIPDGWFYQNQYRSARMMVEYCLPLADAGRGTFSPEIARRGQAALSAESKRAGPFNVYARLVWPVLRDLPKKFANGQASVNLARAAIALERCRLTRGEFPESLDALSPQFIAEVPRDVIGGQPLKYRRQANGRFVLYSAGWNEQDDGGVAGLKQDGTADLQTGDWVWCYPSNAP